MKMYEVIFAIIFFASGEVVFSQPPIPRTRNVADSLMSEGNVPEAIAEYRKLYSRNPEDPKVLYNYACALSIDNSMIRKFDSCYKYLNLAVQLDTSIAALLDPDFLPAREDPAWKDFENRLVTMINLKTKNAYKDPEYAKALWKIYANDQAFFNEIGIAGRKLGMRTSVASALWRAKLMASERNQKELIELLGRKGWPRLNDVGREAAMAAYMVIQHAGSEQQKKYLPEVRKRCEENELPWERYAMMYDRMCVNENKPQRYGTHTIFNEKTRDQELYPLEDKSKVDEWRKEAGLEPLSEYLSKFKIKFEPGLSKK